MIKHDQSPLVLDVQGTDIQGEAARYPESCCRTTSQPGSAD